MVRLHPPLKLICSAFAVILFLMGCQPPPSIQERDVTDHRPTVAATRFSGDPKFSESSTSVFVRKLLKQNNFYVITPFTVEQVAPQLAEKTQEGNLSRADIQKIGKILNADFVITGYVGVYNNGETLDGFSTASMIDTGTGEVIVSSNKLVESRAGVFTLQQYVDQATEVAAQDILKLLKNPELKDCLQKAVSRPQI